ncbi:MAG: Brucella phage Pr [Pseudomonadota bacterium]|jgi:hypothetical protein
MTSIIDERETTHGPFMTTAAKAQQIKDALRGGVNWDMMDDIQREALEMIASKIGRILAGNHDEIDHWRDIAGYAELVVRELDRLNAYIAGGRDPTPRPGACSPATPAPAPAASVWPMTPEEEEQAAARRRE